MVPFWPEFFVLEQQQAWDRYMFCLGSNSGRSSQFLVNFSGFLHAPLQNQVLKIKSLATLRLFPVWSLKQSSNQQKSRANTQIERRKAWLTLKLTAILMSDFASLFQGEGFSRQQQWGPEMQVYAQLLTDIASVASTPLKLRWEMEHV